jgi:hypothetical protein
MYVTRHKETIQTRYSGNACLNVRPDICELNEKQQTIPLYEKFMVYISFNIPYFNSQKKHNIHQLVRIMKI